MTKLQKRIDRFKTCPTDFTWNELVGLLNHFGFKETEGRGSRIKFYHQAHDCLIQLHKPHPAKVPKRYMIREILDILTAEQLI